jgi:hypothetical protein
LHFQTADGAVCVEKAEAAEAFQMAPKMADYDSLKAATLRDRWI